MPPQVLLSVSVSTPTPHHNRTKSLPSLPYSVSVPVPRRPPPPPPPKIVEIINIHTTTATSLPWTYAPNQLCVKVSDTIYFLSINIDSHGNPVGVQWLFTRLDKKCYEYTVVDTVGRTRFDLGMLGNLGKSGIESFGSHRSVWWNIQNFLNEYLRNITEGKCKNISIPSADLRTSAFATSLVHPQTRVYKELGFEPERKSFMGVERPGLGLRRETW